ncbi:MAG: TIGR02147 family protein [Proteobacteria bacterium]|nr:MAG: TIGR02147 family protein [Pseudomonadota bacterium]
MQTQQDSKNTHLNDEQRLKFRLWLQKQFTDRCQKNSRYSLRAFAGSLGLDASTVSQILAGKRAPSKKALTSICEKLSATPRDLKLLGVLSVQEGSDDFYQLSVDTFSVLADWYHFAILELTYVSGFKAEPKWVAQQLNISALEAKTALERLHRLHLLGNIAGKVKKTQESVTNHTGVNTSVARKTLQKQVIAKALVAVDETPQDEKDISSITMAIDPKNLDKAREMIKKFRRELCLQLEEGEQSRVYNLAVQLYPISKTLKAEDKI